MRRSSATIACEAEGSQQRRGYDHEREVLTLGGSRGWHSPRAWSWTISSRHTSAPILRENLSREAC